LNNSQAPPKKTGLSGPVQCRAYPLDPVFPRFDNGFLLGYHSVCFEIDFFGLAV
jgi:hypothetical protein